MTPEQAAERLGAAPHHVTDIAEHPDGHIVTHMNGQKWLITPQVSRPYVPEIDDGPAAAAALEEPDEVSGGDEVPAGSVDEVLAWVGADRERAARALAAEQERSSPRKTLLARLGELAAEET